MALQTPSATEVPAQLVEAVRRFPQHREVEHCGHRLLLSPFDIYTTCPQCGNRIKLRSFSASCEIEDIFDAVFEWMQQPSVQEHVRRRQEELAADRDE